MKSFKNNSAAYENNFRLRDKNHAPFKLKGQSRTAFGLLKAPELQRLSVTVEVLRVGVMTVGVLSVGVMTLSHSDDLGHVSLTKLKLLNESVECLNDSKIKLSSFLEHACVLLNEGFLYI